MQINNKQQKEKQNLYSSGSEVEFSFTTTTHTHKCLGSSHTTAAAAAIMIDTADLQLFLSTIEGGAGAVDLLEIGLRSHYVNGK